VVGLGKGGVLHEKETRQALLSPITFSKIESILIDFSKNLCLTFVLWSD
jgi:hypothetical protein